MPDFDVLAIGGGAAGLTIAIGGSGLGLRVALIEWHRTGGECTWTGCVPSKALLHAGAIAAAARQAAAWSADRKAGASTRDGTDATEAPDGARLDFTKVLAHVRGARTAIGEEESPDALRRRGVTVLEGTARLLPRAAGAPGGHTVTVDGRQVTATHVVIATGSDPATVPIPGLDAVRFFTNESVFDELDTLPARLAVIGGGPIGCELAQAFARLGSLVTLFEAAPRLLMNEDEQVAPVVEAALERDGVVVHTGAKITEVAPAPASGGGRGATLTADGIGAVEADAVLVAAGRRARTGGFGLEEAGVALTKDGIEVDAHLQTSVPGIWAIGDCVGPYRFTHVAEMQGRVVLRNILFPWKKQRFDDRVIPWATFTDPEVGHVGLTERQARERHGGDAEALTFPLSKVDRAITEGATEGFIKLVLRSGLTSRLRGQQILGAHIVAPRAGELVQEVALAMQHDLPVSALSMVHVYPAYAYGLHQAADRAGLRRLSGGLVGRALPLVRRLALRAAS